MFDFAWQMYLSCNSSRWLRPLPPTILVPFLRVKGITEQSSLTFSAMLCIMFDVNPNQMLVSFPRNFLWMKYHETVFCWFYGLIMYSFETAKMGIYYSRHFLCASYYTWMWLFVVIVFSCILSMWNLLILCRIFIVQTCNKNSFE